MRHPCDLTPRPVRPSLLSNAWDECAGCHAKAGPTSGPRGQLICPACRMPWRPMALDLKRKRGDKT